MHANLKIHQQRYNFEYNSHRKSDVEFDSASGADKKDMSCSDDQRLWVESDHHGRTAGESQGIEPGTASDKHGYYQRQGNEY